MLDFCSVVLDDQTEQTRWSKPFNTSRKADSSRVLVALDLKAAFQNVSCRAMLFSIEQNDADLAAVFSKWYTGTSEHRITTTLPTPKSVPTAVSIKDVLFRHVAVRQPLIPYFGQYWQKFADSTTQVPSLLPASKPQYLLHTFALITDATRSVNLELQPSKVQIRRDSCEDPIPAELQDKVRLTVSCR